MQTTIKPNKNFGSIQFLIMSFIWILIFAIPLLTSDSSDGIAWPRVTKIWIEYSFVFLIFLINHFFLFPQFLKGKRVLYFASVFSLLAMLVLVSHLYSAPNNSPASAFDAMQGPMNGQPRPHRPPGGMRPNEFVPPFANLLIMGILIIGFDAGLSFAGKWLHAEQNKIILEKENVENKMAFLQNQISPHFFMNTLNNIHALVDIDTEEAKEAIIRLSRMMAYMLYESQTEKISIQKEINFVKSYVELMKLRFPDEVDVKLYIPETLPDNNLPPLLTISFIENAFKHGVSYEESSFIHIKYIFKKDKIFFEIQNSDHSKQEKNKNSGLGLENARKRLALIYDNNYELLINKDVRNIFKVNLNIQV